MNITEATAIIGAITGTVSIVTTIILNKKVSAPKIKVNLERVNNSNYCSYYNLKIQNISDYNLYDFNLGLEEFERLNVEKETIKSNMRMLKESIPVFTIGQIYDTFLLSTENNLELRELNFNITYRLKPNGSTKREKVTFNINALRNVYINIKRSK